jgi:HK97 gp10 family phage protein
MLKSRIPQITIEIVIEVDDAINEGADWVERDAKARVPIATGALHDAIHKDDRQREGIYVIGGDDEIWYGHLVENGTVRTSPQPFLVPALEENRAGIVNGVQRRLRRL